MGRESAEQWNTKYPKGTVVSVSLRGGETLSTTTATHAQQWGDFALVTLSGIPGCWTISALTVEES
jgi:hypothetical protein